MCVLCSSWVQATCKIVWCCALYSSWVQATCRIAWCVCSFLPGSKLPAELHDVCAPFFLGPSYLQNCMMCMLYSSWVQATCKIVWCCALYSSWVQATCRIAWCVCSILPVSELHATLHDVCALFFLCPSYLQNSMMCVLYSSWVQATCKLAWCVCSILPGSKLHAKLHDECALFFLGPSYLQNSMMCALYSSWVQATCKMAWRALHSSWVQATCKIVWCVRSILPGSKLPAKWHDVCALFFLGASYLQNCMMCVLYSSWEDEVAQMPLCLTSRKAVFGRRYIRA